jgi:hypothetical protein
MKPTHICVMYVYNEDRLFYEVWTEIEERANDLNITIKYHIFYNGLVEHKFDKIIREFVGTISEWMCMKC